MWWWRRWNGAWAGGAALALLLTAMGTGAGAANLCTLTGNLTTIAGNAAANAQVFFQSVSTQSYGGTVVPPGSFSVFTDSNGNLPAGVNAPQGATMQVSINNSQPVQIQIPIMTTADLATLILANNDPPSVVAAIAIGAGGDYAMSVTNPGTGAIGTATLQPGHVTAIQGSGFSSTPPTDAQIPIFSSSASSWQPQTVSGDASISNTGTLSVHLAGEYNPLQYGAKLDAREVFDMTVTNGSTTVASNSAGFTNADVGKLIVIWTAANGLSSVRTFTGTISAVSAPNAILSAPYTGPSQTSAAAFIGTDDGAAINGLFTTIPINSYGIVKVPGQFIMTSQTLDFTGRNIRFLGQQMAPGAVTGPPKGTVIIWAGGNAPVIRDRNTFGAEIGHFAIMGSDQASSQPTACISTKFDNALSGSIYVNAFNNFHDIFCGDLSNLGLPGAGNSNSTVGAVVLGENAVQSDRHFVTNVRGYHATYGLKLLNGNAVGWQVSGFSCNFCGVGISQNQVGILKISVFEANGTSLISWIQNAGGTTIDHLYNENDIAPTIGPPWADIQNTTLSKDFTIEDSNGNFEEAVYASSSLWTTGNTTPTWNTKKTTWTVAAGSCSGTTATITFTQNHDFTAGEAIALVNSAVGAWNQPYTVASVPAANQITAPVSSCTGLTPISSGTMYHATTDNQVTWINLGPIGIYQLSQMTGTAGGAALVAHDSGYAVSKFISYDGDILSGYNRDYAVELDNFRMGTTQVNPTTTPYIFDLSVNGGARRYFSCHRCRGVTGANINASGTSQMTYIDVQRLPGPDDSLPSEGIGEYFVNALVNGDPAGVDPQRFDILGKLREFGGPLTVNQLANPIAGPSSLSCATAGPTTWYYKYTCSSGSGETLPSFETSVAGCASTVSSTNTISGGFAPIPGADTCKIYRSPASGGSGSELFSHSVVMNGFDQNGAALTGVLSANSFVDTVPDNSLGGAPPTSNTTGNATIAGILAAGSSAAAGSVTGDGSVSRAAGSGKLWMGSSGSQAIDFGIANPSAFTLLGGGLFAPALTTTSNGKITLGGAGQLFMGSSTVASLPGCNSSNKLSWLVITDGNVGCSYGAPPAGGGSNICPVFCDGSSWRVH